MTGRGLDFADAVGVFEGVTVEIEDTRKDYGEKRIIGFGRLGWKEDRRDWVYAAGRICTPRFQYEESQ